MLDDYRILVLDSDSMQCMSVEKLLREVGFCQITLTYSAQEALRILERQRYQTVLFDVNMPAMNRIRLIDRLAGQELGQFSKPFTPQQALQLRRQCLARRRAQRDSQHNTHSVVPSPVACDVVTLRHAVQSGAICDWFQPKQSLKTGEIVSAEVLARGTIICGPPCWLPLSH